MWSNTSRNNNDPLSNTICRRQSSAPQLLKGTCFLSHLQDCFELLPLQTYSHLQPSSESFLLILQVSTGTSSPRSFPWSLKSQLSALMYICKAPAPTPCSPLWFPPQFTVIVFYLSAFSIFCDPLESRDFIFLAHSKLSPQALKLITLKNAIKVILNFIDMVYGSSISSNLN